MSRYDTELEVMAEGLHPLDIVWLEKRIVALEAALFQIVALDDADFPALSRGIAESALSEGDASGG